MELGSEVRRLLDGPNVAHLATLLPDGSPHSVPLWVGTRGDLVTVMTSPTSRKALNIDADPRVALSVVDTHNPFSSAVVRGRVVHRLDGDEGWQIVNALAQKYIGQPYSRTWGDRVVMCIKPSYARAIAMA